MADLWLEEALLKELFKKTGQENGGEVGKII